MDYQRVNDSNKHLSDVILQLNSIINKLNTTNHDLMSDITALNFANERVEANFTETKEKVLNLQQMLDEKSK